MCFLAKKVIITITPFARSLVLEAIEVHYCLFDKKKIADGFERLLQRLPEGLRSEVLKIRNEKRQYHQLIGKLLIEWIFLNRGIVDPLGLIRKDRFGRPYLSSIKNIDISLSHSGECVVCVVSSMGRVGVDLELKRPVRIEGFRRHMTPNQWDDIVSSSEPSERLLHYWTVKESVLKADGRGLRYPLEQIHTHQDRANIGSKDWYLRRVYFSPYYVCHIASERPIEGVIVKSVDLDDFYILFDAKGIQPHL